MPQILLQHHMSTTAAVTWLSLPSCCCRDFSDSCYCILPCISVIALHKPNLQKVNSNLHHNVHKPQARAFLGSNGTGTWFLQHECGLHVDTGLNASCLFAGSGTVATAPPQQQGYAEALWPLAISTCEELLSRPCHTPCKTLPYLRRQLYHSGAPYFCFWQSGLSSRPFS